MSSKLPKSSSVSEPTNNKASPKVVSRLSRAAPKSEGLADPGSPLKTPRLSVDRSTRSPLNSKPDTPIERRSPKLTTPRAKQHMPVPKGSVLQAQLSAVQEELKAAKEKLTLIEKEKVQAIEVLKDAQKSADEASEKLREAQVAQKKAEENCEIEKFRAVEMEQAAIESTQKKEEDWKREIEALRNQHALDLDALVSAKEEVQKVVQELTMNLDRANDVTKINATNIEVLEAEVAQLKGLLDAKLENEGDENTRLLSELEATKEELEKAKGREEKLLEKETHVEELNAELEITKIAVTSARKSEEEWQIKVKDLEARNDEKTQLLSEIDLERDILMQELEKAKLDKELACKSVEEWEKKVTELSAQDCEKTQMLSEFDLEIETLKQELEKAENYKSKLADKEASAKQLNLELEAAKTGETNARKSIEEWQKKVKDLESRDTESTQLVSELDLEIQTLKKELEDAKNYKIKLVEKESFVEKLSFELEAAKLAELSARKSMEEWQKNAKESNRLERSASESLESVMKQLEKSNDSLHDTETEIASLKEKVGILEFSITRQRKELEESERIISVAKEKADEMTKRAENLGYELENVEEEKNQALNNEKLAAESVQCLLEEKNKIINELESLKEEKEKNKKEIRSLTMALGEISSQAEEMKERLSSTQTEFENYENQIENLRLVLNATNEKYQTMLDEAKHEIDMLIDTIEQNKREYENSRAEWEQKEVDIMNKVVKSDDKNSSLESEISKLTKLLTETGGKAGEEAPLKEAESEEIYLKEIIGETKAESMKLKESLMDKENELKRVIEENKVLLEREASSIEKIEELMKLLNKAKTQNHEKVSGELYDSEKCNGLPAKVVECYEQNEHVKEEDEPKIEVPPTQQIEDPVEEKQKLENETLSDRDVNVVEVDAEHLNENQKDCENKQKEEETKEIDVKMWEIVKISEEELSQAKEQEKKWLEDELDLKVDSGDNLDHVNGLSSIETVNDGGSSPLMQHQKKKKPLLVKFGSLLKRKGNTNHQ